MGLMSVGASHALLMVGEVARVFMGQPEASWCLFLVHRGVSYYIVFRGSFVEAMPLDMFAIRVTLPSVPVVQVVWV